MLIELRIGQLAIVDELALRFGPGLTVLTGETGAGKSVLAGALALLCGGQVPKELVREGEDAAYVEGLFDLSDRPAQRGRLARLGIRVGADGMLVLRRELRRQGRNRVVINGLASSLAVLERAGPLLMTIQSQDQQRELADPTYARELLDELLDLADQRARMAQAWEEYRRAAAAHASRQQEAEVQREQLDFWRHQQSELARAALREDEEEQLSEGLAVLRHAGALQAAAASAMARLDADNGGARESLGEALGALRPQAGRSRRLAEALAALETAASAAGEAAAILARFLDGLDLDPARLEEMEARKALYEELRRKHRRDTGGLIALEAELSARLQRHDGAAAELAELARRREQARLALADAATALHESRRSGAPLAARRAQDSTRPLALPRLELGFEVEARRQAGGVLEIEGTPSAAAADGADRVALLVRTNPGERMGEAGAIASGGERSRIHLGLTALRRREAEPPLLLCDEIDAGLGMDAGRPVGEMLRRMARGAQVICITHLPTVAVYGDAHLAVKKRARDGRTVLAVRALDTEARLAEVMRLLGGSEAEAAAARRVYAAELLRLAAHA